RQPRCQSQRDVSRIDQSGSGYLGRRAALQFSREILEHLDAKDADQGYRPGIHRAATAAAASADRRDRRRAVLEGRYPGRRAQPDDGVTLEAICDKLIIYGTAESVADQLLGLQDEIGKFGRLLYAGKDWKDRGLGR